MSGAVESVAKVAAGAVVGAIFAVAAVTTAGTFNKTGGGTTTFPSKVGVVDGAGNVRGDLTMTDGDDINLEDGKIYFNSTDTDTYTDNEGVANRWRIVVGGTAAFASQDGYSRTGMIFKTKSQASNPCGAGTSVDGAIFYNTFSNELCVCEAGAAIGADGGTCPFS